MVNGMTELRLELAQWQLDRIEEARAWWESNVEPRANFQSLAALLVWWQVLPSVPHAALVLQALGVQAQPGQWKGRGLWHPKYS